MGRGVGRQAPDQLRAQLMQALSRLPHPVADPVAAETGPGSIAIARRRAPAAGAVATPAAVALIDGLYRWHVARQKDMGPMLLISQRNRFTPELYSQLTRALAMTPSDGGFVDFDVFSGTQVGTYGARVRSCQAAGTELEALVAVQVGLRGRPDPTRPDADAAALPAQARQRRQLAHRRHPLPGDAFTAIVDIPPGPAQTDHAAGPLTVP